jgi:hypothetical protein
MINEKCKALKISNTNNNIIKVKLFPYSLAGQFNFKVVFVERFGSSKIVTHLREITISFKQTEDELLVRSWEIFRGLAY